MEGVAVSLFCIMQCGTALGTIPEGYYSGLAGKSGAALMQAAGALSQGHTQVTYNTKTWGAFEQTNVITLEGREAWWDMYSNNIVWLPEHASLNIEHSVANSWWGGAKNAAYCDLFHLNPSDQNANNQKKNYPPGEVEEAHVLDNGMLKVGRPVAGQGGGATSVFEPADEYKGDFARAYFYVFSSYSDLDWTTDYGYAYTPGEGLQPWAVELLLRWHREDPVDSRESARNEAVAGYQQNRNPFIDLPALAEYIWGNRKGEAFPADMSVADACDRPAAPVPEGCWMRGVNTYTRRWWDGYTQHITATDGDLLYRCDGSGGWLPISGNVLCMDPAGNGERHTYELVCRDGTTGLQSAVTRLTVDALDPGEQDWSVARWEKVTGSSQLTAGEKYILLSGNTGHVMSVTGGVTGKEFMESAGFTRTEEGLVTELPLDAAIVEFGDAGEGKKSLSLSDAKGNFLGYWNATAKNKMRLKGDTYTPGTAEADSEGRLTFTFDQYGKLQFNKSQPRFLNYESAQTPVLIYRFKDFNGGSSGVEEVTIENPFGGGIGISRDEISVPEGCSVYDLNGRRVSGRGLAAGIYIVAGEGRSVKVRI